jgi:hypothetical protein
MQDSTYSGLVFPTRNRNSQVLPGLFRIGDYDGIFGVGPLPGLPVDYRALTPRLVRQTCLSWLVHNDDGKTSTTNFRLEIFRLRGRGCSLGSPRQKQPRQTPISNFYRRLGILGDSWTRLLFLMASLPGYWSSDWLWLFSWNGFLGARVYRGSCAGGVSCLPLEK